MNCLDCGRFLREAIDSVYAQTCADWEIILWDNASTEDPRAALTGYDDRLRYFRGEKTVALGAARNLAMAEARGDLIAFLDCDDIWLPAKLDLCMPCFRDPEVGLTYTDWSAFNESGYSRKKYAGGPAPHGRVFEQALFGNFTCLSTLLVRANIVHQDGIQFDPQFNYIEDTDFLIRIARTWKVAYVGSALTRYRMHSASASATKVDGFRDEMDRLIDKCSNLFPDVAERHADRLHAANIKDRAVDQWQAGRRSVARRLLRSQLFHSWRYAFIYLAFFFPFRLISSVRRLFSRRAIGYFQ